MVNYLGRYIKNLSQATNNLRLLTHNETKWNWNQETEKEFNNIKKIISNINTLKYYNVNEPIILECDASGYGLGVAAYQNNGIIGFASRTLTKSEQNFAQIEKELLAIVFGCVRFDQLMVGNQIMVKTDHKPLINIFKKPLLKTPKRLQRMLMLLQRYDLKITYVSGKDNKVADALSRAPLQYTDVEENKEAHIFKIINEVKSTKYLNVTSRRMKEIKEETNKDPDLQTLMKYINTGWPENKNILLFAIKIYNQYKHELSIQDGIIYRGDQVLIPYKLRRTMIDKVHTSHNGINATLNLAKSNLFWPGMTNDIKNKIKECSICLKYSDNQQTNDIKNKIKECSICLKYSDNQQKVPMNSHEIPVYPFQYVSMDVFTTDFEGKSSKFLVTVDHYSDYKEC
ncbi:Integrase zinc binding domain [Popillia japonica]|uniref:RNA-directed DNA polymerase n=1 Tax=Popillia japonica TaxID=7064 RepID=A0AAW1KHY1_POPJA